jgi:hypothetical protein
MMITILKQEEIIFEPLFHETIIFILKYLDFEGIQILISHWNQNQGYHFEININ